MTDPTLKLPKLPRGYFWRIEDPDDFPDGVSVSIISEETVPTGWSGAVETATENATVEALARMVVRGFNPDGDWVNGLVGAYGRPDSEDPDPTLELPNPPADCWFQVIKCDDGRAIIQLENPTHGRTPESRWKAKDRKGLLRAADRALRFHAKMLRAEERAAGYVANPESLRLPEPGDGFAWKVRPGMNKQAHRFIVALLDAEGRRIDFLHPTGLVKLWRLRRAAAKAVRQARQEAATSASADLTGDYRRR